MDYKYIEQLLERYFQCETTLKEEDILRAFFAQEDVPVWLLKYQDLFNSQNRQDVLGDDFDERMLDMIDKAEEACISPAASQSAPVKARTITLTQRLMPLCKAAAIVAIILTLGNAAQAPWDRGWDNPQEEYAKFHQQFTDSIDLQAAPIQAENIMDSTTQAVPTATATY